MHSLFAKLEYSTIIVNNYYSGEINFKGDYV